MKVPAIWSDELTDKRLVDHLREQLRFIEASAASYDNGFEGEARRLANVLRLLLHDTRASRSLLGQLGVKEELQYVDTTIDQPPLPFQEWWDAHVLDDDRGKRFTRKKLVLDVANIEGDAHVDPALDPLYVALAKENLLQWIVHQPGQDPPPVSDAPALAAVRQIAFEVDRTIRSQLADQL